MRELEVMQQANCLATSGFIARSAGEPRELPYSEGGCRLFAIALLPARLAKGYYRLGKALSTKPRSYLKRSLNH